MDDVKRLEPKVYLLESILVVVVIDLAIIGLQLYQSENYSLWIGVVLNIISLFVFLYVSLPKLAPHVDRVIIFTTFALSILDLSLLIILLIFSTSSLVYYTLVSMLYLAYAAPMVSAKLTRPSSFQDISEETLGKLYGYVFFFQLIFFIIIYGSRASTSTKSLCGLLSVIFSSIVIYIFDRKVRPINLTSTFSKETSKKSEYGVVGISVLSERLVVARKKPFILLQRGVIAIVLKLLQIDYMFKPILDAFSDTVTTIFIPLLVLILLAFLEPYEFAQILATLLTFSLFLSALKFTLSIMRKLQTECKINLVSLWTMRSFLKIAVLKELLKEYRKLVELVVSICVFAILIFLIYEFFIAKNILVVVLMSILLLALLFAFLLSAFMIPVMVLFATWQTFDLVNKLILAKSNFENTQQLELLIFSIIVYLAFVFYSMVMCLKRDVSVGKYKEELHVSS